MGYTLHALPVICGPLLFQPLLWMVVDKGIHRTIKLFGFSIKVGCLVQVQGLTFQVSAWNYYANSVFIAGGNGLFKIYPLNKSTNQRCLAMKTVVI